MTNYQSIGYECERDINDSIDISHVDYVGERINSIIKELTALIPTIEKRKEHIKKHIVVKHYVNVWKTKGVYRDTNLVDGEYIQDGYTKEIAGSHYSVIVHEYIYDTSLIGTIRKSNIESDRVPIIVPSISPSGHSSYSYSLSRQFSWKKKDLAMQYAKMLCDKEGLTLKERVRGTGEIDLTSHKDNSPSAVWNNEG